LSAAPQTQANVFIYSDCSRNPGAEVVSQEALTSPGGPVYHVPLTGVPVLNPGTYWVGVQQIVASGPFWTWQTRTTQSGNPAQWTSISGSPDCPPFTWTPRTTCWTGTNPDQVFALLGSKTTPPPPPPDPSIQLGKLERNKRDGTA
jgi:hypothetical protein